MVQEIRVTLPSEVIKFLNHQLKKKEEKLFISKDTHIGKHLLQYISYAPNGYKIPEEYNLVLYIKDNPLIRKEVSVRSKPVYISPANQKLLADFLRKALMRYWCLWFFKQKYENPGVEERDMINVFKTMFDINEDEVASHAMHVAYWRFRNKFKNPEEFFLENFGQLL